MLSIWSRHLKDEKLKEYFEKSVYGSKAILDRQKAILQEYEDALDRSETSPTIYDRPNWDVRQAHKNGYRECLQKLKTLIDLDTQELPTMEKELQ